MQYVISLPAGAAVEPARFSALVDAEDASAIVELAADGTTLRVSTCLPGHELHALAMSAGFALPIEAIRQRPSECCGGCGG